ncbi:hypothetical protein P9281_34730 [Caballeronia sp. LP003]|uniref:hypothetical protein n=1 Tax=Caballeronia sp. LP003 TaxID=3038551 RepID=UPI00285F46D0|nr:hypothetical protein [Caballeronia sp. LP003]MDR5791705.1 hypothetical protein [Caballeronia sp. LP003]
MTEQQERASRKRRESALYGLLRKYGASLPFADNVIACFQTERIGQDSVEGVLFASDARVRLVFERRWTIGDDLAALPRAGERAMIRVTARPWVDGNGHITLRAKHFVVLPPRCTESGWSAASELSSVSVE